MSDGSGFRGLGVGVRGGCSGGSMGYHSSENEAGARAFEILQRARRQLVRLVLLDFG
jgi:hypothetical protein